ncbi:MAG TPA: hypothetical protein VGK49_02870 [Ilumatobacteraceae bacterium]
MTPREFIDECERRSRASRRANGGYGDQRAADDLACAARYLLELHGVFPSLEQRAVLAALAGIGTSALVPMVELVLEAKLYGPSVPEADVVELLASLDAGIGWSFDAAIVDELDAQLAEREHALNHGSES